MQGMNSGTKGAGKGRPGNERLNGIPEPTMYKGEPCMYAEWKAKLLAYMRAAGNRNTDQCIAWAGEQDAPIVENDQNVVFGGVSGGVNEILFAPHAQLLSSVVMGTFVPRTLGTNMPVLKAIITSTPSKWAEEMEAEFPESRRTQENVRNPCR